MDSKNRQQSGDKWNGPQCTPNRPIGQGVSLAENCVAFSTHTGTPTRKLKKEKCQSYLIWSWDKKTDLYSTKRR